MKTAKSFLPIQLILLFCFLYSNAQEITVVVHDTLPNGKIVKREYDLIPLGDINNDKVADTATVNRPNVPDNYDWDCKEGNCEVIIFITFPGQGQITTIYFGNAVDAGIENIGDIDGDGYSELIAVPGWFIGCWGQYHFYSLKNGRWKEIGVVRHNLCEEEPYKTCIKKIKGNKITAIEQVWEDGDVVEKTKIIEVK